MAQFDVFVRRGGPGFLVDCQASSLSGLNTRFVIPLLPRTIVPSLVAQLNTLFEVKGEPVVLFPQNAATVSVRELGQAIASLEMRRYEIMNALDMLLTGY